MIVRITNPWDMRHIIQQVEECFADFCRRSTDPLDVEQLWELVTRLMLAPESRDTFGFWLYLGSEGRVDGFAMTRFIRDDDTPWVGDLWRVYVRPGASPGVFEESLPVLEEWFRSFGVKEITFATRRNEAAWSKRLAGFGFEPVTTIFRKKVVDDGEPGGQVQGLEPSSR